MATAVIAHRGASADAPENTMAAFRAAWAVGADAIELDVQVTRDGEVVALHDSSLRRTTGRPGEVKDWDWADLCELDAGSWKGQKFAREKIPRLIQVLDELPDRTRAFIEIKGGPELLDALRRPLGESKVGSAQIVWIGFDLDAVAGAKAQFPEHECAWILDAPLKLGTQNLDVGIREAKRCNLDGLDLSAKWSPGRVVPHVLAAGLRCYTWTVNEPAAALDWRGAGADGVTTDRPAAILAAFGRAS